MPGTGSASPLTVRCGRMADRGTSGSAVSVSAKTVPPGGGRRPAVTEWGLQGRTGGSAGRQEATGQGEGDADTPPPRPKLGRFHGSVKLKPLRLGRDASRIA